MIITFKLFAMLKEKLPPETKGEVIELEVEEGTRPIDLIHRFDIPREMAHLVMIDGTHLLQDEVENRILQPGEALAIFPPIAGG